MDIYKYLIIDNCVYGVNEKNLLLTEKDNLRKKVRQKKVKDCINGIQDLIVNIQDKPLEHLINEILDYLKSKQVDGKLMFSINQKVQLLKKDLDRREGDSIRAA